MGIKGLKPPTSFNTNIENLTLSRIYGEIGPGERIALSKLAIEKYEASGRPLRIAIDISIWQFQIQAGQGKRSSPSPYLRVYSYPQVALILQFEHCTTAFFVSFQLRSSHYSSLTDPASRHSSATNAVAIMPVLFQTY